MALSNIPTPFCLSLLALALLLCATPTKSHCQVPCGIFDDSHRIAQLVEDVHTIEKAMKEFSRLQGIVSTDKDNFLSQHQAIRWVSTKEEHASRIITTISEYFLAQRVKEVIVGADDHGEYLAKLEVHHRVIRAAMKTKQTANLDDLEVLKLSVTALSQLYPSEHEHHHHH